MIFEALRFGAIDMKYCNSQFNKSFYLQTEIKDNLRKVRTYYEFMQFRLDRSVYTSFEKLDSKMIEY